MKKKRGKEKLNFLNYKVIIIISLIFFLVFSIYLSTHSKPNTNYDGSLNQVAPRQSPSTASITTGVNQGACHDDDGTDIDGNGVYDGTNFNLPSFTYGTKLSGGDEYCEDKCQDKNTLIECFCGYNLPDNFDENTFVPYVIKITHTCENGCMSGACIGGDTGISDNWIGHTIYFIKKSFGW